MPGFSSASCAISTFKLSLPLITLNLLCNQHLQSSQIIELAYVFSANFTKKLHSTFLIALPYIVLQVL